MDHLVNGAIVPGEELVREAEGDVVDHLGFLEGEKGLVIAARGEEAVGRMGEMGGMGRMGRDLALAFILRIIPIFIHSTWREGW